MGDPKECSFNLKFPTFNNLNIEPELLHFKYCGEKIDFDNITSLTQTSIIPRHSKLTVNCQYDTPALLGEWFPIKIHINNEEEHNIKDLQIQVFLLEDDVINSSKQLITHHFFKFTNLIVSAEFSTKPGFPDKLPLNLNVPVNLDQNDQVNGVFYLRAHKIVTDHIEIKISYILDKEKPVVSIKNENIVVNVVPPFEITTKFLSHLMTEMTKFYVGEDVGVMPTLRCSSPWPIIIEHSALEFVSIAP